MEYDNINLFVRQDAGGKKDVAWTLRPTGGNILAVYSVPDHHAEATVWESLAATFKPAEFLGQSYITAAPLSDHQLAQNWIDLRGFRDRFMQQQGWDYFENSRRAALAQQGYATDNPLRFRAYSASCWGMTACDGPAATRSAWSRGDEIFRAYAVRGVFPDYSFDDGTLAPAAVCGSLPFAPEICLPALEAIQKKYGDRLYGAYGFLNAFNPSFDGGKGNENGWVATDYLGTHQGITLIAIENYESGLVWSLMGKSPHVREALKKIRVREGR